MPTEPITKQLAEMRQPLSEIPPDAAKAVVEKVLAVKGKPVKVARFGSAI